MHSNDTATIGSLDIMSPTWTDCLTRNVDAKLYKWPYQLPNIDILQKSLNRSFPSQRLHSESNDVQTSKHQNYVRRRIVHQLAKLSEVY